MKNRVKLVIFLTELIERNSKFNEKKLYKSSRKEKNIREII